RIRPIVLTHTPPHYSVFTLTMARIPLNPDKDAMDKDVFPACPPERHVANCRGDNAATVFSAPGGSLRTASSNHRQFGSDETPHRPVRHRTKAAAPIHSQRAEPCVRAIAES